MASNKNSSNALLDDPLLKPRQAAQVLNWHVNTINRKVAAGLFPKPIYLGVQRRWRLSTIQAWIALQTAATN